MTSTSTTSETGLAGESELAPILKAYTDVTERLKRSHETLAREVCRLREELHEKNKELQRRERLAALGEMAAGVAHEIRNPLGGIGLYASMLERDLADMPPQLEIVRKLSAGVANLEHIIDDILAFAVDSEPHRCTVRLGEILDGAVAQVAAAAQARGIELTVDDALASQELFCDPAQIQRALINLLMNAFEASGTSGRVRVRSEPASRSHRSPGGLDSDRCPTCRIAVEDNGPGLTPASQNKIFDPFYTTKTNGTGLGLAIVHRIAQAHGGSVAARNRPVTSACRGGGGAVFVLSIPRACETGLPDGETDLPGDAAGHEERAA
ncbi:MAG: hypothetical protein IH989_07825 [Planctomycetes bacterium]|nr:hypothetical protein [Planctomycetota bacterium]